MLKENNRIGAKLQRKVQAVAKKLQASNLQQDIALDFKISGTL